jgi:peptide chain release factor subunit 1
VATTRNRPGTRRVITRRELDQLKRFNADGARALSVYLDLSPDRQLRRAYRVVFKDLVREERDRLDEQGRLDLSREVDRVSAWLDAEEPDGRSAAVFSCQDRGLWQAHFLSVPLPDSLSFEPTLRLEPLLDAIEGNERYAVAVIDKEKARLFTVFLGEIEDIEAFADFVPGKHDQGGPAQPRLQRHHETHVLWHLERVGERLSRLLGKRRFNRLIVTGPEEATSELQRLLPRDLAERVVTVLPGETFESPAAILQATLEVARQAERDEERRLVDQLVEIHAAGGQAACGFASVADALLLGQMGTIVVADGLRAEGSECPNCGRLDLSDAAMCPACGHSLHRNGDVVEQAVHRTLEQRGRVEVVHGEAAQHLEEACHGIGGVVRFGLSQAVESRA